MTSYRDRLEGINSSFKPDSFLFLTFKLFLTTTYQTVWFVSRGASYQNILVPYQNLPRIMDKLFQRIVINVVGHDRAVLKSYTTFVKVRVGI